MLPVQAEIRRLHRNLVAINTATGLTCRAEALCTMRFGSTAKVLLKCKLKYYRISECLWYTSSPSYALVVHPHNKHSPSHVAHFMLLARFQPDHAIIGLGPRAAMAGIARAMILCRGCWLVVNKCGAGRYHHHSQTHARGRAQRLLCLHGSGKPSRQSAVGAFPAALLRSPSASLVGPPQVIVPAAGMAHGLLSAA